MVTDKDKRGGYMGVLKSSGSNRDVIIARWSLEVMGNSGTAEGQKSGMGKEDNLVRAVSRQQL